MCSRTNASNMRISSRPKPLEMKRRVYTRMARRMVTRPSKSETMMKAAGPSVLGFTKFGAGKVLRTDAGGSCMLSMDSHRGLFAEEVAQSYRYSLYSNMRW